MCVRLPAQIESTYQCLRGTVQGVSVVATELGVDTLEGGVTVGLGLLDTVFLRVRLARLKTRIEVKKGTEPVTVSLLALVVLGRVLGLWSKRSAKQTNKLRGTPKKIRYVLAILTVLSR
jgi:hypothetical protein